MFSSVQTIYRTEGGFHGFDCIIERYFHHSLSLFFLVGTIFFLIFGCLYFIPQRVSAFSLSLPCTAILFALVVYLTSFLLTLDLVYEF